jgi:hypothetical protein
MGRLFNTVMQLWRYIAMKIEAICYPKHWVYLEIRGVMLQKDHLCGLVVRDPDC